MYIIMTVMFAAYDEPVFIQLTGLPPKNSITLLMMPAVMIISFSVPKKLPTILNIAANTMPMAMEFVT
ncbi:unknown [Anaerotruncus sp. CAG:390]|nr:unknown [Anaerotruncus sp. CAG:390]